jgi:hypothetical protein
MSEYLEELLNNDDVCIGRKNVSLRRLVKIPRNTIQIILKTWNF